MAHGHEVDIRGEIFDVLLQHIAADRHPSIAMMDLAEQLMRPDDKAAYVGVLLDKVETERFPSLPMLRRLLALT